MKNKATILVLAILVAATFQAGAVEDGLGTNHVRTLRAHEGIVLDNVKIASWQDVSTSTLTNDSVATGMIQNEAVTAAKIAAAVAGAGLTGAAGSPLAVGQGDGISVTADAVAVDASVVRTNAVQTIGGTNTFLGVLNVPAPLADAHAATKLYVDTKLGSSVASGTGAGETLRWNGSAWTNSAGLTVDGDGRTAVASTLRVAGAQTNVSDLVVQGAARMEGLLRVVGIQTNASDLVVEGTARLAGNVAVSGAQTNAGDLVVQGNVSLGDAVGDTISFLGTAATALAMGGNRVTGVGAPAAAGDAATKQYVDDAVNGLSWKAAVKAAAVGNVADLTAVSAGNTLDGVALLAGDRVLLKSQDNAQQNGIYVVQAAGVVPVRAADLSSTAQLPGAAVFVSRGTANAGTAWVCTSPGAAIPGGNVTFAQFASPGTYVAGSGLDLTGLTFSVDPADFTGAGLEVNGGNIRIAAGAAGDGLVGGAGTALAVGAGDGISVTADAVAVDASVVRTNGAQTIGGAKAFTEALAVGAPSLAGHAATKLYVDEKLGSSVASGTVAGQTLRWNGTAWTNDAGLTVDADGRVAVANSLRVVGAQTNASDLAVQGNASVAGTLGVVGAQTNQGDLTVQGSVTLGDAVGDSISFLGTAATALAMGGNRVTGVGAPAAAGDAATKQYVDDAVNGLTWKAAVKAAAVGNVADLTAVSAGNTLDGVGLLAGDRVLLKSQDNAQQNGIYVVQAAGVLPVRAADLSSTAQLPGAAVFVSRGTANAGTAWVCTSPGAAIPGGNVTFAQFASPGTYVAGSGLDLTGLTFSVDPADFTGAGLEVNGGNVRIAAGAAGDGLVGGAGTALAVGAGDGISVTADAVAVNASVVRTNGVQTIGGTNTFLGVLNVPAPTAGGHAATKLYVDEKLGSSVASGTAANETLRWTGSAWTNSGAFAVDGTGNAQLAGALTASGAVTFASATQSEGKDSGALVVEGGVGVEKNLNVGGALGVTGAVRVAATTASTDKDTGALVVEGGVGVEGNLNAGGNVSATGNLAVDGNATLGDARTDSLTVNATSTFNAPVVHAQSAVHQIQAGTGITAAMLTTSYLRVRGESGSVDVNPGVVQIAAGTAGQMVTLQGTDNVNTLKLDDGDGLKLAGGISFTLMQGHLIQFIYDGTVWRELLRSVPAP